VKIRVNFEFRRARCGGPWKVRGGGGGGGLGPQVKNGSLKISENGVTYRNVDD
jgi:hypothetical protein